MTIRELLEKLIVDYKSFTTENTSNQYGICRFCYYTYDIDLYDSDWVKLPVPNRNYDGNGYWVKESLPFEERIQGRITIMKDILAGKYDINLEDKV